MKLQQIASQIRAKSGGRAMLIGDGELEIIGANPLHQVIRGEITLMDSPKHVQQLAQSQASAVIVAQEIEGLSIPQIVADDPHQAFVEAILQFRVQRPEPSPGIHRLAVVDPSAKIGDSTWIGEGSTIGRDCIVGSRCRIHRGVHIMDGCVVGDDCEIFPGAVLYPDTILGDRVLIHASVVLGAYGFGYRHKDGKHLRTAQLGRVRLEDDVEVGAGSTVDRATYGETTIGEGTKIDNLVMIGHNVTIGKHNLICAQVGIAGSTTTGDYVVLAGQVGVKDHVRLGDRVVAAAQSGIAQDVEAGMAVMGAPAIPSKKCIQVHHLTNRLPQFRDQLKELEATVAQLKSMIAGQADRRVA